MNQESQSSSLTDHDASASQHMGSILCKSCGELIDTFDSEKVVVYYSIYSGNDCKVRGNDHDGRDLHGTRVGA